MQQSSNCKRWIFLWFILKEISNWGLQLTHMYHVLDHVVDSCRYYLQSNRYINTTQRNLQMWPLWAVLTHGHVGQLPGGPTSIGINANLCMLWKACFLMFEHWFCWKYQYMKYMFNFFDIYSFIPVGVCVGRGLNACYANKTALVKITCIIH